MKKILLFLVAILGFGLLNANAQEMRKGTGIISLGAGFFHFGAHASYDHGLIDTWGPGIFTVGGELGFSTWANRYSVSPNPLDDKVYVDYRISRLKISPRATYRYAITPEFEVFGAVSIGFQFTDDKHGNFNRFSPYTEVVAGCRYAFTRTFGVFAESGWSTDSFLRLGVNFLL